PSNDSLRSAVNRGKASNYVHTSKSPLVALGFVDPNRTSYLYTISKAVPGAIDVSTAPGVHSAHAHEKGVSVLGGIDPEHIEHRVALRQLSGPAPGAIQLKHTQDRG